MTFDPDETKSHLWTKIGQNVTLTKTSNERHQRMIQRI